MPAPATPPSSSRPLRRIENPFPHFAEATQAASRFLQAQRDYLVVTAELRAKRESKRAAYLAGALLAFALGSALSLFWVSMGLHEAGWSSWSVALACLLALGAVGALCAWLGLRAGRPSKG